MRPGRITFGPAITADALGPAAIARNLALLLGALSVALLFAAIAASAGARWERAHMLQAVPE